MADQHPWRRALRIAGGVVVAVVIGAALHDITSGSSRPTFRTTPNSPLTPSPSAPSGTRDPSAPLLAELIVSDTDVGPSLTVAGLRGGNGLTQPTLDLCNGTFPSEAMRTARLQVAAVDGQGETALSTEAVLYSSGAGTAAAFSELKATAAACPAGAVESPVGQPTVTTHFGPAPDGTWPQVPSVERLAFAFETTSATGDTSQSVAVYLRRGRAFLGVYFSHPDATTAVVEGHTSLPDIVTVFANRLAKLPVAAISTTA
ncbi:MAG TPA: hypothetical protein VGR20_08575 [Acidimicrobiia bacterium]|jgi:hypothetical protein|nr:hypothetical protein [Acidimicrobiia bacterium]